MDGSVESAVANVTAALLQNVAAATAAGELYWLILCDLDL